MTLPPVITLSRSLGSGGSRVGYAAARELGWRFCDRHILRQAARNLAQPLHACQDERPSGFFQQVLNLLAMASPEVPYTPPVDLPVYGEELYEAEAQVMRHLAEDRPVVLVGRGGFLALGNRPRTLHVRVDSAPALRAEALVARGKAANVKEALARIADSDAARIQFFHELSGLDWRDTSCFGLVLDPHVEGLDACVARVVKAARHL